MAALDLHIAAQYLSLRVIESLAEGTGIFACAALLVKIVPGRNARTRFAVWFSALIAIAAAPVVTGIWSSRVASSNIPLLRPAITIPDSWALYLLAGWIALSGWFLSGIIRALWRIRMLKKSCIPVDAERLDPLLQRTLHSASTRRVSLCISAIVRVPAAIGLTNAAIVLPQWTLEELTPNELNQILIHEIAHLRRRDDWTNLMQQFVKALFFFHPAVWWIEKEAALEREMACDDEVLEQTANPRAYAECLAHLAERTFVERSVALAQAVLGKIRQTSARVARILDGNRPTGTRTWTPAVSLVAGVAIFFSIGAARFQGLIGFENEARVEVAHLGDNPGESVGHTDPAFVQNAKFSRDQTIRATPARLSAGATRPAGRGKQLPPATLKPKSDAIRLAALKESQVPIQETVLLVIQGSTQDLDAAPGIQLWHVTVLHYVVEPAGPPAPRKQI